MAPCVLTESGPIEITQDNAVIELLRVRGHSVTDATKWTHMGAVSCRGAKNVRIKHLLVEHPVGSVGIGFDRCDGLVIEDVEVRAVGDDERRADGHARPGPCTIPNRDCDNIHGKNSKDVFIHRVRVSGGSSGIELHGCTGATLRDIVARDVRGPYPRGQCVQFSNSHGAVLESFHCVNDVAFSWPEDSISVWRSRDVSVRFGLIDGNNAPNGVGVMFENDDVHATGGSIADVDAIHMGDGCFSAYPASSLTMVRTRCGWNHCTGVGGRAAPSSGGMMWAAGDQPHGAQGQLVVSREVGVFSSSYWAACRAGLVQFWSQSHGSFGHKRADGAYVALPDVKQELFTPRAPITVTLCWEDDSRVGPPPVTPPPPPTPRPPRPPSPPRPPPPRQYPLVSLVPRRPPPHTDPPPPGLPAIPLSARSPLLPPLPSSASQSAEASPTPVVTSVAWVTSALNIENPSTGPAQALFICTLLFAVCAVCRGAVLIACALARKGRRHARTQISGGQAERCDDDGQTWEGLEEQHTGGSTPLGRRSCCNRAVAGSSYHPVPA